MVQTRSRSGSAQPADAPPVKKAGGLSAIPEEASSPISSASGGKGEQSKKTGEAPVKKASEDKENPLAWLDQLPTFKKRKRAADDEGEDSPARRRLRPEFQEGYAESSAMGAARNAPSPTPPPAKSTRGKKRAREDDDEAEKENTVTKKVAVGKTARGKTTVSKTAITATAGAKSTGAKTAGEKPTGTKTAGTKAAGVKNTSEKTTASSKIASTKAAGAETATSKTAGTKAAGDKTTGAKATTGKNTTSTEATGTEAATSKTATSKTSNTKAASTKTNGAKTAVAKTAGSETTGSKTSGTKNAGAKTTAVKKAAEKDTADAKTNTSEKTAGTKAAATGTAASKNAATKSAATKTAGTKTAAVKKASEKDTATTSKKAPAKAATSTENSVAATKGAGAKRKAAPALGTEPEAKKAKTAPAAKPKKPLSKKAAGKQKATEDAALDEELLELATKAKDKTPAKGSAKASSKKPKAPANVSLDNVDVEKEFDSQYGKLFADKLLATIASELSDAKKRVCSTTLREMEGDTEAAHFEECLAAAIDHTIARYQEELYHISERLWEQRQGKAAALLVSLQQHFRAKGLSLALLAARLQFTADKLAQKQADQLRAARLWLRKASEAMTKHAASLVATFTSEYGAEPDYTLEDGEVRDEDGDAGETEWTDRRRAIRGELQQVMNVCRGSFQLLKAMYRADLDVKKLQHLDPEEVAVACLAAGE